MIIAYAHAHPGDPMLDAIREAEFVTETLMLGYELVARSDAPDLDTIRAALGWLGRQIGWHHQCASLPP